MTQGQLSRGADVELMLDVSFGAVYTRLRESAAPVDPKWVRAAVRLVVNGAVGRADNLSIRGTRSRRLHSRTPTRSRRFIELRRPARSAKYSTGASPRNAENIGHDEFVFCSV